jgi:hypothetical protein
MNFSSYEELYDVFKNTAVFYKTTNISGQIRIPPIEADAINLSQGDNATIAIINQMFDDGYVKFNGNLVSGNRVTIPKALSSNTNRDEKFRENLSGLFICKKGKYMPIPFDLSSYYKSYLLSRGLIFKSLVSKKVESGMSKYTYYRAAIPTNRYNDRVRYSYLNSRYNCYYINLGKKDGKNIIKEKETEPASTSGTSYAFTLPREKALDSPFSKGDTVQVIAQRTKEMFNIPDRLK